MPSKRVFGIYIFIISTVIYHFFFFYNKDYESLLRKKQVDQNTDFIPEKRSIQIPSAASIEEMRAVNSEAKPKWITAGKKIHNHHQQQQQAQSYHELSSPNRTPFGDVN